MTTLEKFARPGNLPAASSRAKFSLFIAPLPSYAIREFIVMPEPFVRRMSTKLEMDEVKDAQVAPDSPVNNNHDEKVR